MSWSEKYLLKAIELAKLNVGPDGLPLQQPSPPGLPQKTHGAKHRSGGKTSAK